MYSVWQRNYLMKLITDNKEKKIEIKEYNPNISGNTFFFCVTHSGLKKSNNQENRTIYICGLLGKQFFLSFNSNKKVKKHNGSFFLTNHIFLLNFLFLVYMTKFFKLLITGHIFLLLQNVTAFSNSPIVWFGHSSRKWTTSGRIQFIPIILVSSEEKKIMKSIYLFLKKFLWQ